MACIDEIHTKTTQTHSETYNAHVQTQISPLESIQGKCLNVVTLGILIGFWYNGSLWGKLKLQAICL